MTAKNRNDGIRPRADTQNMSTKPTSVNVEQLRLEANDAPRFPSREKIHNARNLAGRLAEMLTRAKTEILAGGLFLTHEGLAQQLNMDARTLRISLVQAEARRQIFSVEHDGELLYPSYAFLTNGNITPSLQDVITVLHPQKDGWGLAFWFRSPNTFLDNKRPEDVIHENPGKTVAAAHEEASGFMPG